LSAGKRGEGGKLVLEWRPSGKHPDGVVYALDGEVLGEDDEGFSAVLRRVDTAAPGTRLVVWYELRVPDGGQPADDLFPFAARREELEAGARTRGLALEYRMKAGS